MTFANMIVNILDTPEHADLLHEKAKAAVDSQGWTDAMLNRMPGMD